MMRRTAALLHSNHSNNARKARWSDHKYKELSKWKREAQGISRWDEQQSHRLPPRRDRFNPDFVANTRGTSAFAWKWWHTQQPFLPNVRPSDTPAAHPVGFRPPAWDDDFAARVTALTDAELEREIKEKLTVVIFNESQRDGYELRRLNFEGKPTTELPDPEVIEGYALEEPTLQQRVLKQVVEQEYRLAPTSGDRKEMKTVANIVRFIVTQVTAARPPRSLEVTDAVREVLSTFHLQPRLGFHHALPTESRDPTVVEWERLHHHEWQFGSAVYTPRSREKLAGNITWLREVREDEAREAFRARVASGAAEREHRQRVLEAASAAGAFDDSGQVGAQDDA